MKKVLFVAYGSGHIKMVVPLAQALAANGMAKPVVLALTTAAPVARAAGLEVLQFRDFVTEADGAALALGLPGSQGRRRWLKMPRPPPARRPAASARIS